MDTMDSDSECSDDTSVSGSSSSSSSSKSSQYEDTTELAKITNLTLQLPKGLSENPDIFREFFSMETWKQVPDNFQAYLKNKFLPHFSENNEAEQEKTLQMLFNNEISRFGTTPLHNLQSNLEEGNYRPDVLKLQESISKSRKIEQQFKDCERVGNLAKSLMISRERLLRVAHNAPPGSEYKIDRLVNCIPKLDGTAAAIRAKKRFYYEISSLTTQLGLSDCSDDELKDFNQTLKETKHLKEEPQKKAIANNEKKIMGTMTRRNRVNGSDSFINTSTTVFNDNFLKQILLEHNKRKLEESDRPEFETNDIRITDVHNRAELAGGCFRKILLAPRVKKPCTKSTTKHQKILQELQQQSFVKEPLGFMETNLNIPPQSLLNDSYINDKLLSFEKPIMSSFPMSFESLQTPSQNSQNINNQHSECGESEEEELNVETINSPKRSVLQKQQKEKSNVSINLRKKSPTAVSKSIKRTSNFNGINNETLKETFEISQILVQQNQNPSQITNKSTSNDNSDVIVPDKLNDPIIQSQLLKNIEGITESKELQSLIIKPTTPTMLINSINPPAPELMQETHACFLSLIRDIFCATPNHRMKLDELKSKICSWLANPITALNDWYNQSDNWLILIPSSIHFLSGEFIDQPDEFVPYIEFKPQQNIYQWIGAGRDSDSHLLHLCQYWLLRRHEMGSKPLLKLDIRSNSGSDSKNRSFESEDSLSNEKPISPPPPRCPTSWTVQVANVEEIDEFRAQERQRFENPHKAFTYRMYGFESVVGPVKGVYTQILALTKARGHTMLTADRPNFVTILTLVRDATARLPNGEGTRADICELLKCSQYVSPQAAETVLQTIVSGALDRMHVEYDPCVRYDPKRKIWIYLHRNRTEEEFERLHQQFQGVTKNQKKPLSRKIKQKGQKVSENSLLIHNNSTIVDIKQNLPQPQQIFSTATNQPQSMQKTNASQSLPALSSISNYNNQQQQQSALVNTPSGITASPIKITNKQKVVNIFKPELVPIIQNNQQQQTSVIIEKSPNTDFDNMDLDIEPPKFILQKPQNYQQKLGLVSKSSGKNISNLHFTNLSSSGNAAGNNPTQQIRVATPTGIQTVHVSALSPVTSSNSPLLNSAQELQNNQTSLSHQIFTSAQTQNLTTSTSPQQILITSNKKIITSATPTSTTSKPFLLQNQHTGGQLITQIRAGAGGTQGYIIPLSSDQLQVISSMPGSQGIITSHLNPKIVKCNDTQLPGLTTTNNSRSTIMQPTSNMGSIGLGNKNVVRVATTTAQAGKSLISPHVAATNITLQQQKLMGNLHSNIAFQQSSQQQQQQQQTKLITNATVIRPQLQKTAGITLMNSSSLRPTTTLTPTQQKQILQNLVAQQQKQHRSNAPLAQNTLVIPSQQSQKIQTKNVIIQQSGSGIQQQQQQQPQHIPKIINVSGSNLQTVTGQNIITSQAQHQNNFNSQIIQIHQPNTTVGGTKIQTINASLLQSFKQQHIRLQQTPGNIQQPSLIIKQQMLQQSLQKSIGSPTAMSVSVDTVSPKNVNSIMGTNFIATNPTSLAPGSIVQTQPQQNIAKHTNLLQPHQQTQQTLTKQFAVVSQPHTITRVIKTVSSGVLQQPQLINSMAGVRTQSGNPVMAKVLTNNSGQIISLESLLQKQGVGSNTTLRMGGSKTNQTSLIQLAGTPGSQITQYAVVSQGRNIISVSGTPQRLITTQATNSNIVTSLSNSNSGSVVTGAIKSAVVATGNTVNIQNISGTALGTTVHLQNSPKVISTNQLTAQQLMNAKVLGKAGTTGIRMLNASNLNIAHIRGKPVIIASKANNHQQQQLGNNGVNVGAGIGQNVQIIQSSSVNNNGNIIIGGQTLKVQGNVFQAGNMQVVNQNSSTSQSQTVMLGNQILKVAQSPMRQQQSHTITSNIICTNNNLAVSDSGNPLTTIASTNTGTVVVNSSNLNQNVPKTVVLSSTGQTIRVQSSSQIQGSGTTTVQNQQILLGSKGTPIKTATNNQQRVVLAVQGGGQIFLPPGFQSGSINLKSLQGLKVVSLAPQQVQNKGVQKNNDQQQTQRPVFAQIFTTTPSVSTSSSVTPSTSSSLTNTTQNSTGGN